MIDKIFQNPFQHPLEMGGGLPGLGGGGGVPFNIPQEQFNPFTAQAPQQATGGLTGNLGSEEFETEKQRGDRWARQDQEAHEAGMALMPGQAMALTRQRNARLKKEKLAEIARRKKEAQEAMRARRRR